MNILYSNVEPLSKLSPVTLHLSPATMILNENPDRLLEKKYHNTLKLPFEYTICIIVFVEVAHLNLSYHSLLEFYFKLCFMSM